jgi:hypothetical protein
MNATGAALVYSSYLGGNNMDQGNGIAVDSTGNAYVTGFTYGGFPTTPGAFQTTAPKKDGYFVSASAFVTKIDPPSASVITVPSGLTTAPAAAAGISVSTILPLAAPSVTSGQSSNDSYQMPQLASAPVMFSLAAASVASVQLPNESSRMPELASAPVRTAQTTAATPAAHASPWDKPMTARTALVDDVFVRGDWLAQALVGDLALAWIR